MRGDELREKNIYPSFFSKKSIEKEFNTMYLTLEPTSLLACQTVSCVDIGILLRIELLSVTWSKSKMKLFIWTSEQIGRKRQSMVGWIIGAQLKTKTWSRC